MEKDRDARLENQHRLRSLRAVRSDLQLVCGHDPIEFERVAGRRMSELPEAVRRTPPAVIEPYDAQRMGERRTRPRSSRDTH